MKNRERKAVYCRPQAQTADEKILVYKLVIDRIFQRTFNSLDQLQVTFFHRSFSCQCLPITLSRAANNFSFLKGLMSDQVSILVGQNRNVVGRFFNYYLKWKSF